MKDNNYYRNNLYYRLNLIDKPTKELIDTINKYNNYGRYRECIIYSHENFNNHVIYVKGVEALTLVSYKLGEHGVTFTFNDIGRW